jgi:hypothetical protein
MTREIDWERVEEEYRAGLLSLREIAGRHSITEGAIRKRAKRDDWTRDLAAKVQARADDLVRRAEVRKNVRVGVSVTERVLIEANAQVIAEVRSTHRGDITRARVLAMAMLAELEMQTGGQEELERMAELLASPDEKGVDKMTDLFRKVISTPGRIDSLKKVSETMKNLITLEREAYGLATAGNEGDRPPASKPLELTDERLAAIAAGRGG